MITEDAWSISYGVQAYVVTLPDAIRHLAVSTPQQDALGRVVRHITLFTLQGVKAFESNRMLASEDYISVPPLFKSIPLMLDFCAEADIDAVSAKSFRQQP